MYGDKAAAPYRDWSGDDKTDAITQSDIPLREMQETHNLINV